MELDSILKLNDAHIKTATAQADVAGKLIDNKLKLEAVLKARLENIAKFLDIRWDSQAHTHLLRTRNLALQKARDLEREREKLRKKLKEVNWLVEGSGSLAGIVAGWIAYQHLVTNFGGLVKTQAQAPDASAYEPTAWLHLSKEIKDKPPTTSSFHLISWARQRNYFPHPQGAAWRYIVSQLTAINQAAEEEATELEKRLDVAKKEALALEERDWNRLDQPSGRGASNE